MRRATGRPHHSNERAESVTHQSVRYLGYCDEGRNQPALSSVATTRTLARRQRTASKEPPESVMNPKTTPEDTTDETLELSDAVDSVETVEEELLVEEISIDGMCGVY